MSTGDEEVRDPQARRKAAYVKPELREYGAIAELTATVGTNAMPDGGTSPLSNMVIST